MEETKRCPYCGEEILAVAKKCKHCGEWLDDDDKELEDEEPQKVPCPACAEMIDSDATVCPFCKEKLVSDKGTSSNSHVEERQSERENEPRGFFSYCFVDPYIHNFANFRDAMATKHYWMAVLANIILGFGTLGISIIIDPSLMGNMEIFDLHMAFTLVPFCAMMTRRYNDAKFSSIPGSIIYLLLFIAVKSRKSLKFFESFFEDCDGPIDIFFSIVLLLIVVEWAANLVFAYWFTKKGEEVTKPIKFTTVDWVITGASLFLFFVGLCVADF